MPLVQISGSNIGSMTANGGLAAAFDGTTSQAASACAALLNNSVGGYVGKTLTTSSRFGRAIIYGSNDVGFRDGGASTLINIRGKNGSAPSSRTDGTVIGTLSFSDTSDESAGRTIESTDVATVWDHIFAQVEHVGGGNHSTYVAELVIYTPVRGSQVVFVT